MAEVRFILNEEDVQTGLPPGTTLLDFIRYHKNLKGTKIGCREGDCGACTVLTGEIIEDKLRYRSVTSCLMALGNAHGKHIVTIEGINFANALNPIQQAIADEGGTQCGFCTPGFVMSLAGYCLSENEKTEQNAVACMDGNICRCTGYKSIERAATKVNNLLKDSVTDRVAFAAKRKILPEYFAAIRNRLEGLAGSLKTNHQPASNKESQVLLGGGTDLYVQKHDSMAHSEIQFLFDLKESKSVSGEGNRCVIGAGATVTDLLESDIIKKSFPEFGKYAKLVSSTPIRNMATLAGNFVNASPIGDFTIFFLALDATLVLSDGESKRDLPLKNFYKGYKTLDKKPGEQLLSVSFELPEPGTYFNFEKVSKRTHLDIATVNTAIRIKMDGDQILQAVISAGGVFAFPKVLGKTGAFLKGKKITEETIDAAVKIAQEEIAPISDARGSEAYKRLLLTQLLRAHFIQLFPGLNPTYSQNGKQS